MRSFDYSRLYDKAWDTDILNLVAKIHESNEYIPIRPSYMLYEASRIIVPLLAQKVDILHPENVSHLNGFASIWCSIENIFLAATAEGYA